MTLRLLSVARVCDRFAAYQLLHPNSSSFCKRPKLRRSVSCSLRPSDGLEPFRYHESLAEAILPESTKNGVKLNSSVQIVPKREPDYSRLFPCPQQNYPARIDHLLVEQNGNVVDIISKALSLPPVYVTDLIDFGAVHYALHCPTPPASCTPEHLQLYKRASAKYTQPKGKTLREAQKTFRVVTAHQELDAGMYLRVHVHPKRFPRCYEVDWLARIITETELFVIIDKPAGISVGGTVDNLEETCVTFTARALGLNAPLIVTHQIDSCTEGCVVFAKTKEFASQFHQLLRTRKVEKEYCALAATPVPVGRVSHFMRPDRYPPRILSKEPYDGWHLCELEVLDCQEVPWPSVKAQKKFAIQSCGWPGNGYAYQCRLKLLTGRTHQVRAQFAALGAPLIGDSVYMPAALVRSRTPEVDPILEARPKMNDGLEIALDNWVSCHGPEPECAIGLQAASLSWPKANCTFKSSVPWWKIE